MNKLRQIFKNSGVWSDFLAKKTDFCIENETSMTLFVDSIFAQNKKDILVVTSTLNEAQLIHSNLSRIINIDDILFFPNDEVIRLRKISQSKEIVGERIYTLGVLANARTPKVVITNFQGALRFLTEPKRIKNATFELKKNDTIALNELKRKLQESGYQRVDKITASLQYASRGDIVDVFPINSAYPIRIDFFDDSIEEIRKFRISNQKSFESLDKILIYPGSDHQINIDEIKNSHAILNKIFEADKLDQNSLKTLDFFEGFINKTHVGIYPTELERFVSLLKLESNSILDYLHDPLVLFYNNNAINNNYEDYIVNLSAYNDELVLDHESIPNLQTTNPISIYDNRNILKCDLINGLLPRLGLSYLRNPALKDEKNLEYLRSFIEQKYDVIIGAENLDAYNNIFASLQKHDLKPNVKNPAKPLLNVEILPFYTSFALDNENFVYLNEADVFFMKKPKPRFVSHYKEGSSLESYLDLEPGDYVVHELYGIARYKGLKKITSMGLDRDCLELEYANSNTLYVPVLQIDYVRKYLGRDGYHPTLTRLNTKDWERMKKRVKNEINDSYDKLLELYKKRLQSPGIAFQPLEDIENELGKSFPHELTEDQERSLKEILADMASPFPMDRLLCGDVGFGKTEVSLRASMRALINDYQVSLICPTTILANQHYELFKTRLEPLGFKVALLSRFVSKKEQKSTLADLEKGKIDVLVATHRAISKDVVFKRLGFLIIDEEQRFGVKQKEAIKQKYPFVDVLTLSATPIPRTLQMSLLSLRPISRIDTPPPYRNPIQTYVVKDNESLVKEIIEQELGRNGQVFYLSNRIIGINEKVSEIEVDVPRSKVGLVHGQMDSNAIEQELYKFHTQEINVLVCTTIIENGIDYPNANTLIVENAQNFGLAQLYQIKGRVGRSDRIAYAYLMYNQKQLTDNGIERLKAIQQYTELGSGYKIAEQDLLIRGAGEIIGENQSGFITNVGLDMYTKLFDDVMYERTNNQEKDIVRRAELSYFNSAIKEIDTTDDTKMELYQKLSRVSNFEELNQFRLSLVDEFGRFPDGIDRLLEKKELDLYSNILPIKGISEVLDEAVLMVDPNTIILLKSELKHLHNLIRFPKFAEGEIRVQKNGEDYLKDVIMVAQEIIKAATKIEGRLHGK